MDQKSIDAQRSFFSMITWVINTELVIILIASIWIGFYITRQDDPDRFFAETGDGKLMQMTALPLPNLGKTALGDWVATAASQIMTFGFNDIDARFAESRVNFTPEGWESFRLAMVQSGLIDQVMSSQQIVSAVPLAPAELRSEGLIDDTYSWVFDMRLLITFRAGGAKKSSVKMVHVVLKKVSTRDSPSAVGIGQWMIY